MKDQVEQLAAKGLPAACLNSSLSDAQRADVMRRLAEGELKLLYVAPERFDAGPAADRLRQMGVSLLAVDEAHCISEWGHDFRPSYLRIGAVRQQLGDPPTLALTATATPEVRRDIVKQLALRDPTIIVTGFDRKNLHLHVLPMRTEQEKDEALIGALREREGVSIVYATTRRAVERITLALERARISAVAYHAGLDDEHRHEVQDAFMTEQVRAIVATTPFGMGIDKPNVRLVVHHAMPGTLEAYYQEAGRAGRDGGQSECILLHSFPDRFTHEFFIKGAYPERSLVESVYEKLRRRADAAGGVHLDAREIAGSVGGRTNERDVESALRILQRGGALVHESESASRVLVRLLATPDRIKRELVGALAVEREFLRVLWRAVGARLERGAVVDLDGLPPGFSGYGAAMGHLEALESRQFLHWERTGGGSRLVDPGLSLASFEIDWNQLDRRRRADLGKLDAMQKYAYTTGCRRAYVLRYFGDDTGRGECGGCDNCLGLHRGVERSASSAPGRARTTGAPARHDATRGTRRRGRSSLTEAEPISDPRAAGPEMSEPRDQALFAELKSLRSSISREEKVPAYVVFADRTLAELATRRPRSLAGLSEIRGVGPAKLERYGERFLAVIRDADDTEAA
jgi:ATP-dependent DNA helicase RecQ